MMGDNILAICPQNGILHVMGYRTRPIYSDMCYSTTGNCRSVYFVSNDDDGHRTYVVHGGLVNVVDTRRGTLVAFHDGARGFQDDWCRGICVIRHDTQSITFPREPSTYHNVTRQLIPMQDISYIPTSSRDKPLVSGYLHSLCVGFWDKEALSTHINGTVYTIGKAKTSIRDPRISSADLIDCGIDDISSDCYNLGSLGDTLIVPLATGALAIDTRNLASYDIDMAPVRRFTYE